MKRIENLGSAFNAEARKSLTLAEAVSLFQELADLPLMHDFIAGGCYARAHLMCAHMQQKGITPFIVT